MSSLTFGDYDFLKDLGLDTNNLGCYNGQWVANGGGLVSMCPSTGKPIANVTQGNTDDYESCVKAMDNARAAWAATPAPQRGEIVRQIGDAFRAKRDSLGKLVSLEMGKILSEGIGEVQEIIDICDYAVGLSRMMAGQVIPSERPGHVILENWNPLGHIAIITAFNFPAAVLGWNLALSLVCGNTNIWKPASSTSLVGIATARIVAEVLEKNNVPRGVFTFIVGSGRTVGEQLINDKRMSLVSFTGSTEVGKRVSEIVHSRFGRTILELGGNNATLVMENSDHDMALRASVFGAVGTCGQRCTSLRRLYIHRSIYDEFVAKMVKAYSTIVPGNPLVNGTLLGPIHSEGAIKDYLEGLEEIKRQGGKVLCGGKRFDMPGYYVEPTIVTIDPKAAIVNTEIFAPILYVFPFDTLEEAIAYNNAVPQGLSSSIFSRDMRDVFQWMGPAGSDCGIVNVNMGSSGAEIGGAFGGEKETGGGRESGSDSWKQYARRSTCAINYSNNLPLAQGVKFDI